MFCRNWVICFFNGMYEIFVTFAMLQFGGMGFKMCFLLRTLPRRVSRSDPHAAMDGSKAILSHLIDCRRHPRGVATPHGV